MPLDQIANTSQGRMVGDYISTSFLTQPGLTTPQKYTTAVDIGQGTPTSTQTFDEATYAPLTPITVATGGAAAQTSGAHQFTGQGTGETHHALRDD